MRNQFVINDDYVTITITRRSGATYQTDVSLEDLDSLLKQDCIVYAMPTKRQMRAGVYFYSTGESLLLHRLIMSAPAGMKVDHIDHNPLNNRRTNIRLGTNADNLQNLLGARSDSSTGIRGVYYRNGKWYARAQINGKQHWLGTYDTANEAEYVVRNFRAKYMTFSLDHIEIVTPYLPDYEHRAPGNPNKSSGFRNVYWHKHRQMWYVSVGHNHKHHSGGYFDNMEDAIVAAEQLRNHLWSA